MRRILSLLLATAATGPALAQTTAGRQDLVVRTRNGLVAGVAESAGVRAFRGLPFAAPPVRELRWRPPQPAKNWTGVRRADRFADQCMQARVFGDMMFRNSGVSEDCLYLNVWTPAGARAARAARLPVLVYFYGGGFVAGDGSEFRYDGASMARRGIVVVTTSYRLGAFGFLAHPELTRESPHHASGNYALMDQAAALRWVRDNIAAFGGDPGQVTIAGESAGSFSVSGLMASPLSKDLFQRAIGESGAFFSATLPTPSRADAERTGLRFAEAAGAHSLAELRHLSAMEILAASSTPGLRVGPDIDGWFFPQSPAAIYAAGREAHVPLLAGWNEMEVSGRSMVQGNPTPANVAALLGTTFGAESADAARVYPTSTPEDAALTLDHLASDRFIAYSTWKWLEEQGRTSGRPVYRYLFARPRPAAKPANGQPAEPAAAHAVHSGEIEYALGNLATNPVYAWTPADYEVSNTMESYFANFIKTGNPNGPGLPVWPVGAPDANGRVMHMRIDVHSRAEPEDRARYRFLDRVWGHAGPR